MAGHPRLRVAVADLGLACCAVEFAAAVARGMLVPSSDVPPEAVNILVVSGTVTDALLGDVMAAWESLPLPRMALSFGACSNSGGPYWDSYSVVPGIDAAIPVASYVPGCPPRPEALVEALVDLAGSAV